MYCVQCGKEMQDGSRFCPSCGAAVGGTADEPVEQVAGATAKAAAGDGVGRADAPASLKAATTSSRKKGIHKMPMVFLVALALALSAGVAFAAYVVYTNVIAPQTQEQEVAGGGQQASESEAQTQQRMRTLFKQKCDEYIAQYGEPGTSLAYSGALEYITGLSYAELIDCDGDGTEELLLAYYDQEAAVAGYAEVSGTSNAEAATGMPYGYIVEVWRYDADADEISLVFSGNPNYTNGGATFVGLVDTGGNVYLEGYGYPEYVYYGPSEDGTFAAVADAELAIDMVGDTLEYASFSAAGNMYQDFLVRELFLSEFVSADTYGSDQGAAKLAIQSLDECLGITNETLTLLAGDE